MNAAAPPSNLYRYRAIKSQRNPIIENLPLFHEKEHRPFHWSGGKAAALLVHGFPGTAAELRPLGQVLHQANWTVRGMLLPGFGPDIETLADRSNSQWLTSIKTELTVLRRHHQTVVLIGYSMGAALAIQIAATESRSGLVLLAPFQQLGTCWQRVIGFLLSPFIREVQPFKKADFSDPETRQGLSKLFSGLDLGDPQVQQSLRQMRVSTKVFDELNRAGKLGHRAAAFIMVEKALLIYGQHDEVVRPAHIQRLLQNLPARVDAVRVEAGHDLLDPAQPAWPDVTAAILEYADAVASFKKTD